MHQHTLRTPRRLGSRRVVGLALASSVVGLLGAATVPSPAAAAAPTRAHLSAARPFFGVRLHESFDQVDDPAWEQHDYDCGVRGLQPASPPTAEVHVVGDREHPDVARSIDVYSRQVVGPLRTRLGERPSAVSKRLGRRTRHAYHADGPGLDYYWIKRIHHAYLWVRAGEGSPVYGFGLSASKADAVERATTLGGCY